MQLKLFILPVKNLSVAEGEVDGFLRAHRVLANRNNNIGFRVVLAPAQPLRRRAYWLTRMPSCPARKSERGQTEVESRPVQVGRRSFPKAPGGASVLQWSNLLAG